MSEYQEKHSIAKLIGSPPGYVGYEDTTMGGGMFINEVEKNPHAVVLFDEVEKAHRDVSNMLLQVMDYGTVTGSNGKKADCRNITLIMTSNLGAEAMERNNIGFGSHERSGEDDVALKKFFPPEFKLGARPVQRVIDEDIKKPLSKMILFGELQEGGMVEVALSKDVVPKLTVKFKAKKVQTIPKPTVVKNEKTS